MNRTVLNRLISLIALAGVLAAWFAGSWHYEKKSADLLAGVFPESTHFEQVSDSRYIAAGDIEFHHLAIGQGMGYEGPLKCVLVVDSLGKVSDIKIVEHAETPSYYAKIEVAKYLNNFLDRPLSSLLLRENEPDAVSGATYTSVAITNALYEASKTLAEEVFHLSIPPGEKNVFRISFLDLLILLFLVTVLVSYRFKPSLKKKVRYTLLITSVATLGFTYNFHLTISRFNSMLLGYWPDLFLNPSWYLLLGGVILGTVIIGKNPYCHWFCPFGAVQEGIGKISNSKWHLPLKYLRFIRWIPRFLAWLSILLALFFRNPGSTGYEPFGMFFSLTGSAVLFAVTIVTLVLSLFMNSPWCTYACPVPPVMDLLIYWRGRLLDLFQLNPDRAVGRRSLH